MSDWWAAFFIGMAAGFVWMLIAFIVAAAIGGGRRR